MVNGMTKVLHRELLDWFAANERPLPWREAGVDGWGVLVSEVMSQQTPVARVAPVWREWMRRWPRPSDLAAETTGEVVRAWGRLGYPRRAMRLQQAAAAVAAEHGDVVPADVETLESLPGIGTYTARAVAAFAYGAAVPVVDTNVRRVHSRVVRGVADASPSKAELALVAALLPETGAARFSAAVMEFGALVCTARGPSCADCPLSSCAWRTAGFPVADAPRKPAQRYEGTDRQARGRILGVLRASREPVAAALFDAAWPADAVQRERALASLLADGLVVAAGAERYALAGEG